MQMDSPPAVFSIGHSNHDLAALVGLLREAGVAAVADVRSYPYSRRSPQFNRPDLERALRPLGMSYLFLGDRLGGRPDEHALYDDEGRVDYERVRATPAFVGGLDSLLREAGRCPVAMLCSEADPLDCHRGLMITPALIERGLAPLHIHRDGRIETTAALEERLLAATGVGEGILNGLFAAQVTPEERRGLLAEAYRVMARRKAFQRRPDDPDSSAE
jgi:uncharacterized protein (DUF488 family)